MYFFCKVWEKNVGTQLEVTSVYVRKDFIKINEQMGVIAWTLMNATWISAQEIQNASTHKEVFIVDVTVASRK